ncbi:hypothetical protein [Gallibacterium anatis]|uniref:Uncharacterized protein n=1 Tax=Gallibacterium anatis 12656/12 TaxID=1195244 RepID=U1IAZ5_9PAST|nr:hypothetical protein [Gallibacterium anatis]ERF79504.1 hypothetical protein N561_00970 [Gallibacterium anatis 12656/12]KGQ49384.1 hypothetical protein JL04_05795 [Gallibacterium anatis]
MPNPFHRLGRVEGINAKSTALSPILWILGVLFSGMSILYWVTQKEFVIYVGFALIFIVLVFALYSYNHFMKTDPDFLRSESFKLTKLAMEKGHIGDTSQGLQVQKQLTNQNTKVIEVEDSND